MHVNHFEIAYFHESLHCVCIFSAWDLKKNLTMLRDEFGISVHIPIFRLSMDISLNLLRLLCFFSRIHQLSCNIVNVMRHLLSIVSYNGQID